MTNKRKYPIAGTDFFTKIMDEGGYYIDKTDVIPWLLSRMKLVVLFTRPRRFGKSTMLSILRDKPVLVGHIYASIGYTSNAALCRILWHISTGLITRLCVSGAYSSLLEYFWNKNMAHRMPQA